MPANSVWGRLGIGPGPSQAIPISQLGLNALLGNQFTQFTGPIAPTKTFTLPNVSGTLAMLSQIQIWTAAQTFGSITATTYNGGALSGTFSGTPTFSGGNFITNANLATMPPFTIKGNNTGGTANAADLTGAQVEQLLQFTQTGTGAVQRTLDSKVKDAV